MAQPVLAGLGAARERTSGRTRFCLADPRAAPLLAVEAVARALQAPGMTQTLETSHAASHCPMEDGGDVSTCILRAIVKTAVAHGMDRESFLREIGVDEETYESLDGRIPFHTEHRAWLALTDRLPVPGLGIAAAEQLSPGAFRAVEYLVRTSETLGTGLIHLIQFDRILHGRPIYAFDPDPRGARLTYLPPHDADDAISGTTAEFALASIIMVGRDSTGIDFSPDVVRFSHSCDDAARARSLFRAPVLYGQPLSELVLDSSLLNTPMKQADEVLCSILRSCAEATAANGSTLQWSSMIQRMLSLHLGRPELSLSWVSQQLGMNSRTLQKRLQAEGTSFQQLLAETRAQAAKIALRRGASANEVASLLGYADVTAFHRAFRRWTQTTPGKFQRRPALSAE